MTRAPSSGSPSFRSSSNSETRGSAVTFFVCSARLDNRKRGEPSTEVATFTNEQYGSPEPGSNVASAPDRASRRSFLAARKGSKALSGFIGVMLSVTIQPITNFTCLGLKSLLNHIVVAKRPHFRPGLWGSKCAGRDGRGAHADNRSRRRRPQYSDFGIDGARSRGLSHHDIHRRRLGAGRFQNVAAGSRDSRYQDAAHGRHGDVETSAAENRRSRHLPHVQGRGDRRVVRPQDGRRRFHPQTVLAAAACRAREGRAAPIESERRHSSEGSRFGKGAGARPTAHGPRATYLHVEGRARHSHGHRVSYPAGTRNSSWRGQEPQRADGRRI